MSNDPFRRSTAIVWGAAILLMSVPVVFIWLTAESTIREKDWSPSFFVIFFFGGILLLFAYLSSLPVIQLMTKYTENGIEQPSLFGSKFLPWHDVQEIRNITTGAMILIGTDTKISINLNLFQDPHAFLSAIRSRIPEYAFPSEAQIRQEILRHKQADAGRSAIGAFIFMVVIIVIGRNVRAVMFGLLVAAFMIYEIRNWLKYRSLRS
jgi:hypothetical protein